MSKTFASVPDDYRLEGCRPKILYRPLCRLRPKVIKNIASNPTYLMCFPDMQLTQALRATWCYSHQKFGCDDLLMF